MSASPPPPHSRKPATQSRRAQSRSAAGAFKCQEEEAGIPYLLTTSNSKHLNLAHLEVWDGGDDVGMHCGRAAPGVDGEDVRRGVAGAEGHPPAVQAERNVLQVDMWTRMQFASRVHGPQEQTPRIPFQSRAQTCTERTAVARVSPVLRRLSCRG